MTKQLHFLTYPFPLLGKHGGGLLSAFLREASENAGEIIFLTADTEAGTLGRVPVRPAMIDGAPPSEDARALRKRWFSTGLFQLLHPDAYTDVGTPRDTLEAMYQADEGNGGDFGLQRLLDFVERHAPPIAVEDRFNAHFDNVLQQIPPGSSVHWQDLFLAGSIHRHSQRLRAQGCRQTLHLHEPLPPSLQHSAWGRSLLQALSRMDKVHLHTDAYVSALAQQLQALELPVPELARFDLGIDKDAVQRGLATLAEHPAWWQIPGLQPLQPRQRACIEEIFRSLHQVPHRFLSADRLDPIKGNGIVIDAVERFLEQGAARGESLERLQARYRFFMLHDLWDEATSSPDDMQWQYIRHVRSKYERVERTYPGIVWVMPSLEGANKVLLPGLMRGAHGLTGGVHDGLNLAIMENLVINADEDTSAVAGTGAGFVSQSLAEGLNEGACFVTRGSVQAFAEGLEQLVTLREASPGRLREAKRPLVDRILRRNARLTDE
jgi:hypothetical protein